MSRRKEQTKLSVAFGHAARSLREKAGYTQEEFANDAGIDRAYYGLPERGGHTPTITTVWKIAEALGKRPRDVIAAVERELAAEQEPKAEKGARESKVPPAAKKTGKRLGYAGTTGQSGKVRKPAKGRDKD